MSVKKVVEKDTWFIAHNQAKVLFVRVGKPSFPVEKRAIDLLDIWVRNSKILSMVGNNDE